MKLIEGTGKIFGHLNEPILGSSISLGLTGEEADGVPERVMASGCAAVVIHDMFVAPARGNFSEVTDVGPAVGCMCSDHVVLLN